MSTLTLDIAEEVELNAGLDGLEVIPDYSGRGMYGEETIAFSLGRAADMMRLGVALVEAGVEPRDLPHRVDSLGLGIVVY